VRRFASANTTECTTWLAHERPDVVVINGTRILSAALLSSCNAVFLNIHCGITPAYRGVHGAYWALYRNDHTNAGVTVHVVDRGIDTGGSVYQETIQVDEQDNFLTYPVKQYIAGMRLMQRALNDVEKGSLRTAERRDLASAIWQHPTLWQYLAGRWSRGVR
jgi:folate-dependent phosphoribosylglycinamide formyltransferase PurN